MSEPNDKAGTRRQAIGYLLGPTAFAILAATGAALTGFGLDWPATAWITTASVAFLLVAMLATISAWGPTLARFLQPKLPAASTAMWTLLLDKPSATTKRRILGVSGIVCAACLLFFALWPEGRTWSLVGITVSFAALLSYYGMKCCRSKGTKGKVFVALAAYLISVSANYLSSVTVRDETGATLGFAVEELQNLREEFGRANQSLDNLQTVPEQLNRIENVIGDRIVIPQDNDIDLFEGISRDALRVALAENAEVLAFLESWIIPVTLNDNSLEDVLSYFEAASGRELTVDWDSLTEVGVERDTYITFQCESCTLEEAFDGVFLHQARQFERYLRERGGSDEGIEQMYLALWGVSNNKILVSSWLPPEASVRLLRRFSKIEDPVGASRDLVKRLERGGLDLSAQPQSFTTSWLPLAEQAIKQFGENPRFSSIELGLALRSGGWSMIGNQRWNDAERLLQGSVDVLRSSGASTEEIINSYRVLLIALETLRKTDEYRQVVQDCLFLARQDLYLNPMLFRDVLLDSASEELKHEDGKPIGRQLFSEALALAHKREDTKGWLTVQSRQCQAEIQHGDVEAGVRQAENLISELESLLPGPDMDQKWIDESTALAKASYGLGLAKNGDVDKAKGMFASATELVRKHDPESSTLEEIIEFMRKQALED